MDPYYNESLMATGWIIVTITAVVACYQIWGTYKKFYMISPEYKWIVFSAICFTLTGASMFLHYITMLKMQVMFEIPTFIAATIFFGIGVIMLLKSSWVIKSLHEVKRKD